VKPTRITGSQSLSSGGNDKPRCNGKTDTDKIAVAQDVLLRQNIPPFVRRFGEPLLSESDQQHADARLIWDTDTGQTELQRRAVERSQRAGTNAKQQEARQQEAPKRVVDEGHTIEELPDGENTRHDSMLTCIIQVPSRIHSGSLWSLRQVLQGPKVHVDVQLGCW
jgi:hypothetical protein